MGLSMNGNGRFRQVRWRVRSLAIRNPQRLYAGQESVSEDKQSELHGDMQSRAEMPRPSSESVLGSNNSVGPYPPWALEA